MHSRASGEAARRAKRGRRPEKKIISFFVPFPSRAISHARGPLRVSRFALRTIEKRETARSLANNNVRKNLNKLSRFRSRCKQPEFQTFLPIACSSQQKRSKRFEGMSEIQSKIFSRTQSLVITPKAAAAKPGYSRYLGDYRRVFVQVIACFVVILGINTTSDISNLLYVILRAVRRVKFVTILKYHHEWYLCQISGTNHAIICLYYYPEKVCKFLMQVFQIQLKYHCSKPIKLQKFLMQQYNASYPNVHMDETKWVFILKALLHDVTRINKIS